MLHLPGAAWGLYTALVRTCTCCTHPARCYVPGIPRPSGRAKKTCLSVFLALELTPSALNWYAKGAY